MNIVITGASRGIGKAVAEIFASHGHNLLITSRKLKNESRNMSSLGMNKLRNI